MTQIPEKVGNTPATDNELDLMYETARAVNQIIDYLHTMEEDMAKMKENILYPLVETDRPVIIFQTEGEAIAYGEKLLKDYEQ